jgi:hypothetical protein
VIQPGDKVDLTPWMETRTVCVEWETETVTIHYDGRPSCYDDFDYYDSDCTEYEPYDETITRNTDKCLRYEKQTFLGPIRVPERIVQ